MDDDEMLSSVTASELLEFRALQFPPVFIAANPELFLSLDWVNPVPLRAFLLNRDASQPPIGDMSSLQRPSTFSAVTTGQMVEDHPDMINISSSHATMEETVPSDSCPPTNESKSGEIPTDGQDELATYFARGCISHAKRLDALPLAHRKYITAAFNGSSMELEEIMTLAGNDHPNSAHFLPAFWANLDPAKIPSPVELDDLLRSSPDDRIIVPIISSLEGLRCIPIQDAALPDLWPRVWEWFRFMYTFEDSLPRMPTRKHMAVLFVTLISRFAANPTTTELIFSVPGVRLALARAWAQYIYHEDATVNMGFVNLCRFLRLGSSGASDAQVQEYIDGAGGSPEDLAGLVVKHLKLVLKSTILEPHQANISAPISFALNVGGEAFHKSLLSRGIVRLCMDALWAVKRGLPSPDEDPSLEADCLILLQWELNMPTGYPHIAEALQARLLDGLLFAGDLLIAREGVPDLVHHFLTDLLPSATVYHSILTHIQTALVRVGKPQSLDAEAARMWDHFITLAEERLRIKAHFDSEEYVPSMACGNPLCGTIGSKLHLRRCAACKDIFYCSRSCQILDWKTDHRAICNHLSASRLAESPLLTRRNKAFMRALLDHDYAQHKAELLITQCRSLNEAATDCDTPSFVVFDYLGRVALAVHPFAAQHWAAESDPEWAYYQRRVAAGGRVALHVMIVRDAGGARNRFFPMMSSDSRVHDGLVALAREIPPEVDAVPGATRHLLGLESAAESLDAELFVKFEALASLDVRTTH
ncbi:hypothetical protein C8R43DRAFT_1243612 [Mycena crocata]|nr:hypothetical protein C8R43DRAFT_1243612 [Mycena crocata]